MGAGACHSPPLLFSLPRRFFHVFPKASNVNTETAFCLERWGVAEPPAVEELLEASPNCAIVLVDHQQTGQINPAVLAASERIVGIIDHHAL